jgi:1,2-diacylglycerol 3-alpha-glucosyltransferase
MKTFVIHFARFGPYHHARLKSASEALAPLGWDVVGLETAGNDATYAWDKTLGDDTGPRVITAFPKRVYEEITAADCKQYLHPLLDAIQPDTMAIAGWAASDALSCLSWCRKNDKTRIVMSETREADGKRVWWKERIKRYLISRFDGALVGGKSHRDYLVKLGMPADKICFEYNVVDNGYFAVEAAKYRCLGVSEDCASARENPRYFLASNRFIERKNLARLIEAYGRYAANARVQNPESRISNLCLLGDGELRGALIAQCQQLGLEVAECAPWEVGENFDCSILNAELDQPSVFFPGFRQIEELPKFYSHARCFVHPALEEPWGLVLNEAMACGLPVLSGRNVGAAEELVDDGVNGWCFDAENVEEMAECLRRITDLSEDERLDFGSASARILEERCPTEAFGKGLADILLR